MSWDVARRGIDLAFETQPKDELILGFFGGEPLLEWSLLQRATEYAAQKADRHGIRLRPTLTTNGTLLTTERLGWLFEHGFKPAVSLDGGRAMHEATRPYLGGRSSFDAAAKGVQKALAVFPDLEVIAVVDPANVAHLPTGLRYLVEELGVTDISLNPNFNADWSDTARTAWRQAYQEVGALFLGWYREARSVGIDFINSKIITRLKDGFERCDECSFGEQELAVAPSGRLYPCERLIGTDTDNTVVLGDVFLGIDRAQQTQVLAQRGNTDEPCETCAIRDRCMNWCGCVNYATTGAIDRTAGILCFHEKMAVEIADEVATRLFAEGNPTFFQRFYYEDLPG